MSIWFDEFRLTSGGVAVSKHGFDAGLREVLRCVRFVRTLEFTRIFGLKAVQAAIVEHAKTRVMELRWGPLSIGGAEEFGALGGVVGAGAAEPRDHRGRAGALGGARRSDAPSGARISIALCVLRRGARNERGCGGSARCGGPGVPAFSRSI